jgi:GTP-binding protein
MIYQQAEFALDESDLVLLVVDTQVGTDDTDIEIARRMSRSDLPCLLVANKADNNQLENEVFDFLKLGLGDPLPISATIGRGIGELLDRLVELLPEEDHPSEDETKSVRVAVVGRPNVGKSSFINRLIGQERLIVTPVAGTTRDAVDTEFEFEDQKYVLVDTAGLRKKYRVYENIEFYTNLRAARAIDECDVAVVLIDAEDCLTAQDQHILDTVFSARRPAVLVVNKWDLIEKDSFTADQYARKICDSLARFAHLPIIFVSARTGQRVLKVLSLVIDLFERNHSRITTAELNEFLLRVIARKHPPARRGKHIKLNYITQTEISPPSFVIFSNAPTLIDRSYVSYLENRIREQFQFDGIPFRLKFRKK